MTDLEIRQEKDYVYVYRDQIPPLIRALGGVPGSHYSSKVNDLTEANVKLAAQVEELQRENRELKARHPAIVPLEKCVKKHDGESIHAIIDIKQIGYTGEGPRTFLCMVDNWVPRFYKPEEILLEPPPDPIAEAAEYVLGNDGCIELDQDGAVGADPDFINAAKTLAKAVK
jgi:hypothetical protein